MTPEARGHDYYSHTVLRGGSDNLRRLRTLLIDSAHSPLLLDKA